MSLLIVRLHLQMLILLTCIYMDLLFYFTIHLIMTEARSKCVLPLIFNNTIFSCFAQMWLLGGKNIDVVWFPQRSVPDRVLTGGQDIAFNGLKKGIVQIPFSMWTYVRTYFRRTYEATDIKKSVYCQRLVCSRSSTVLLTISFLF